MGKFCPSEEMLGEFVSGCLPVVERTDMEKHLCECEKCRTLVAEAHQAIGLPDVVEMRRKATDVMKKKIWLVAAVTFLLTSFLVPGYFFQFLLASLISGVKWIADSRNAKTIVMIQEDRQSSKETHLDNSFPRVDE